MEIFVAKSAGFCFGVQNAVKKAEDTAKSGVSAVTLGPIIHNKQVVEHLLSKGVGVASDSSCINEGDRVIIRSHGVSKEEYNELLKKNAEIIDATCPYVKNIHKIVGEKYNSGYKIIIIGDSEHPEVKGINGWCDNSAIILDNTNDIDKIPMGINKVCIVSQTTYNQEKWYEIVCKLLNVSKEILIFNTICSATEVRQKEAMELSKQVDAMIVIGGKESSNTRKLYEICKDNCPVTLFVETAEELDLNLLNGANKVGITAGASTPEYVIKEVVNKIESVNDKKAENKVEKSRKVEKVRMEKKERTEIDEYFANYQEVYTGSVVEGKVLLVTDKEVFFDIGYKSDAVLPAEEASNFPVDLKEKFKVDAVFKLEVIKMNDGEGNVVVSRKFLEKEEFYDRLYDYKEKGEIIDVTVIKANKGGLECQYGDVKAFLPLSQAGIPQGEDINVYSGKKLNVKIVDIKEKRGSVELVISRKEILKQEKEKRVKEFFDCVQNGQTYRGIVKSIIPVGAFVNIGNVDVFVPVSEISWKRISHPADVIKENTEVEVLIIKVNKEEFKITGSIKRTGKEPWEEFISKYKEEDIVEGKVVRFAEFGAFVELMDGVDGLIHISNLSDRRVNKPQEIVKIGQIVKVKITKIDNNSKKISLSLKDVEQ